MDPNPTPFPVKNQATKSKPNPSKLFSKETSLSNRQIRVFGTVRNANIQAEKPGPIKILPRRQPEWNPTTRVPIPEPTKKKKKNAKTKTKNSSNEENVTDEKTPIAATLPSPGNSDLVASNYQSAKICSKCRFDRLETSSYWLAQIKLSESVGKHFVSAAFFRLAFESKAEPMKKLRLELKRYLGRNCNIGGDSEWREVCLSYGVSKYDQEIEDTNNDIVH